MHHKEDRAQGARFPLLPKSRHTEVTRSHLKAMGRAGGQVRSRVWGHGGNVVTRREDFSSILYLVLISRKEDLTRWLGMVLGEVVG